MRNLSVSSENCNIHTLHASRSTCAQSNAGFNLRAGARPCMASSPLTFVIVGPQDHPIYEVDLSGPKEVCASMGTCSSSRDRVCAANRCMCVVARPCGCHRVSVHSIVHAHRITSSWAEFSCSLPTCPSRCPQQQSQYLYQFVLHAALDALDDAASASKDCHLKVGEMQGG